MDEDYDFGRVPLLANCQLREVQYHNDASETNMLKTNKQSNHLDSFNLY